MNDERRSTLFEQIVDHHEKEQNSLRECREIVRRLAEPQALSLNEIEIIIQDAARLWAKMQREVGDGA